MIKWFKNLIKTYKINRLVNKIDLLEYREEELHSLEKSLFMSRSIFDNLDRFDYINTRRRKVKDKRFKLIKELKALESERT